jgi:hypothetical protein
MPSKRGRRAQEPAPPRPSAMSYAEWKAKVAAELSGPIAMTERQWRQLYINLRRGHRRIAFC